MNAKSSLILLATSALIIATLACNWITGKSGNPLTLTEQAEELTIVSPTPPPQDNSLQNQPGDAVDVKLGEELRNADGGYAFLTIPGYTAQQFLGITTMEAPDASQVFGPFIMITGGMNDTAKTTEQLFDDYINEMQLGSDQVVETLEKKSVMVGGYRGSQVDFLDQEAGQEAHGRLVVVAVSPIQPFMMLGIAPVDRWDEIEVLFDAVLASVYFFEPEVENIPSIVEDENASNDDDENSNENLPQTPKPDPGEIFFMISRDEGLPVMVENYSVEDQYQSSSEEIILGLVSPDQDYTVILALPKNLSDNTMLGLIAYDPYAAVKAPSAAVYIGDVLYTAQNDGLIIFDEITDTTITGTFFFDAVNPDDPSDVISVMGTFVQLSLPK